MSDTNLATSAIVNPPAPTPSEPKATDAKPSESVSLLNEPEPKPASTPSNTSIEKTEPKDGKKADAPAGAPEKYEAFNLPEGFEASEEIMTSAQEVFKAQNLTQAQGQALVDLYAKISADAAEAPVKFWVDKQNEWRNEIKADPEIGGSKLTKVKEDIGKMYTAIVALDPKNADLVAEFRDAMNYTGAGNNPAFVKFMNIVSQRFIEGSHVPANPPADNKPKSAAQALYPNLPSQG